MFRPKQDAGQKKIRLPKRNAAPAAEHLQFMSTQAMQYNPQEVEVSWADGNGGAQFRLVAKADHSGNVNWKLWRDVGEISKVVWSHDTIDIELIANMISMLNVGEEPSAPQPAPSSVSPYRNLFSSSYHGLVPGAAGMRESLIRMRSLDVQSAILSSVDSQNVQTVSTGSAVPVAVSDAAPSSGIKQTIENGLKKLAGNKQIMPVYAMSDTTVTGTLEQTGLQNAYLVELISAERLTGKLEFNAQDVHAEIFVANGDLHSAFTASSQGNEAITELFLCPPGSFRFTMNEQSPVQNVNASLKSLLSDSLAIRDKLSHLEKAGLKPQSLIIKTLENLGDSELRILLMKNSSIDIDTQISLYKETDRKFTFMQLLGKRPMSKSIWVPILFNFLICGLIEIKAPLSTNDEQLEFLGEAKAAVLDLKNTFIRKETNILTYPALLYFLQYEFLRYQSYDWPLSLIVFEMNKQSAQAAGGLDLIDHQETLTALLRIAAIKRPLDHLGHFEAIDYALLLPSTTTSAANQIAHQIIQVLRAEPLSSELDDKQLKLSFGIANVPDHCDNIESMIILSKKALSQAKGGHFPVILANS